MYIRPDYKERGDKNMGVALFPTTDQSQETENLSRTQQNKLTQLRDMTAAEILQKYEEPGGLAVDIAKILYILDIKVIPFDFTELEKSALVSKLVQEKGLILGVALMHDEKLAIFYRKGIPLNQARFTLAHELAHCCQHIKEGTTYHIEFRQDENSGEKKEEEANIFAGELLIPEDRLLYAYNKLILPYSASLAKLFYVPINLMESRLKRLKFPYYNIRNEYIG